MCGQKLFKTLDFLFVVTLNNVDQLQQSGSSIECHGIEFEWKRFGFESFGMYPSLSQTMITYFIGTIAYIVHIHN